MLRPWFLRFSGAICLHNRLIRHKIVNKVNFMVNDMARTKKAKILSKSQIKATLQFLKTTRNAERDIVMFLLSVKSGMRAKEISEITWSMITDPEGIISDVISIPDSASKGKGGRIIPLNRELKDALAVLMDTASAKREQKGFDLDLSSRIIASERGSAAMSANSIAHWFKRLYGSLGFDGCSSHSGRRTAITTWARNVSRVSGSIRDVQSLAGHSSMQITQAYIDVNFEAKQKLVDLV
jgi:integrase